MKKIILSIVAVVLCACTIQAQRKLIIQFNDGTPSQEFYFNYIEKILTDSKKMSDGSIVYYNIIKTPATDYTYDVSRIKEITYIRPETPNEGVWVDLGLSVSWATKNIGATSTEDLGTLFSWGETTTKDEFIYNQSSNYGQVMNNISGSPIYDAATANWGKPARMPTQDQILEMFANCDSFWDIVNDVQGMRFISRINGKTIFFPCSEEHHTYWSATSFNDWDGWSYYFSEYMGVEYISAARGYGYMVRAVAR